MSGRVNNFANVAAAASRVAPESPKHLLHSVTSSRTTSGTASCSLATVTLVALSIDTKSNGVNASIEIQDNTTRRVSHPTADASVDVHANNLTAGSKSRAAFG